MFFNFTKEKIIRLSVLAIIIFSGAIFSTSLMNKYKVKELSSLYTRSFKEDMRYWWQNKLLARNSSASVFYANDGREAKSIPVLVYHGLPDEGGGENPFSADNFAEHMRALKNDGWNTISLEQFNDFVRGKINLPEKSFLLTFDDGRKDTFYPSDPVLKDLGFQAVMYAITKKSLSPDSNQSTYYMSEYELLSMEESNHWEVESHGRDSHDWYYINDKGDVGHFFSNLLWVEAEGRNETEEEFKARVAYDLSNSRKDLENALEREVKTFAFPFSDFGQDTVNFPGALDIVTSEVEKHYDIAFYQVWEGSGETFNYRDPDKVMMKRIEPYGDWTPEYLLDVLGSGLSKDLPYQKITYGNEWIHNWGEVEKGDSLTLKSGPETTGSGVMLNGSYLWQNYTFTTDMDWQSGSHVVLAARREDDENYFACNFGRNGKVYIKSVIDDSSYNIVSEDYSPASYDTINLGISVEEDNIKCLVNGRAVIESLGVNQRIPNGGVGLEVWDERKGVSNVRFYNITVNEN